MSDLLEQNTKLRKLMVGWIDSDIFYAASKLKQFPFTKDYYEYLYDLYRKVILTPSINKGHIVSIEEMDADMVREYIGKASVLKKQIKKNTTVSRKLSTLLKNKTEMLPL